MKKIITLLLGLIVVIAGFFVYQRVNSKPEPSVSNVSSTKISSGVKQSENTELQSEGVPIIVTIAGENLEATFFDNAAAHDLENQLPIHLTFRDFAAGFEEKIGDLPNELLINGMPEGEDPDIGDIAYWSPQPRIVFYWGDVSYYAGIHRIGRFNDVQKAIDIIERQSEPFEVTISAAN